MSPTQLSPELINTIAGTLRAARERRGDGFGEIALRIALTSSQLKAIEAGNLQPFYSGAYYLQAAQRYADFLGVPLPTEEPVGMTAPPASAVLPAAPPPDPPPPPPPPPPAPSAPSDASSAQAGPEPSPAEPSPAEPPPAEPPPEYLITRQAPSQDVTQDRQLHTSEVIVTSLSAPADSSATASTMPAADVASRPAPSAVSLSTGSPSAVSQGEGTRPGTVAVEIREDPRSLPWGWILLGIAALIVSFVAVTSFRSPAPPAMETSPVQEAPAQPAPPAEGGSPTSPASPGPPTPASPGAPPAGPSTSPAKSSGSNPATSGSSAGSAAPATTAPTAPRAPAPASPTTPASPVTPASPTTPAGGQAPAVPGSTSSSQQPAQGSVTRVSSVSAADSHLESQAGTWVQIVRLNGEKVNLRIEAGQKVDFAADSTAAIVFGQPERAVLRVKGKPVNLSPFLTGDSPQRALVILSQIRE